MSKSENSGWKPKSFHTFEELSDELDKIEAAHHAGTLTTRGEWTVGQNLEHCAIFMDGAYNGFDAMMAWPMRLMGKLLIKPMLAKPNSQMKPGFQIPKKAAPMRPREDVGFEEGLAKMRGLVGRVLAGEKMTQDSPFLGKMTHEQWVNLHLNHCRMHFGFFDYGK